MDTTITMTKEIMQEGMSCRGGWSNAQFRAIGVIKFAPKGWKRALIGKQFSKSAVLEFLRLRNKHIKVGQPNKKNKKKDKNGYIEVINPIPWKQQYKHPNWQRKRLEILERDRFACRICLNKDRELHVHHLKYNKGKFIWQIHEIYLVTLCENCHRKEHDKNCAKFA